MAKITIVIDNEDGRDAPQLPWTAYIKDSTEEHIYNVESGLGATPEEALADLATNVSNWGE